jgi:hypothetical protein
MEGLKGELGTRNIGKSVAGFMVGPRWPLFVSFFLKRKEYIKVGV